LFDAAANVARAEGPDSEIGNAMCVFPGACSCQTPLLGNGISVCYHPVPAILRLDPDSGPSNGGTLVKVIMRDPVPEKIEAAYC
jgi:hypothetical protein